MMNTGLAALAAMTVLSGTLFVNATPEPPGAHELRLMSFNIRHCRGADDRVSIRRTADVILREKPDIVGLQEVDRGVCRSARRDQPMELSKLTGMHATFAKAIPDQGGEFGNAILSHENPMNVVRIPLPGLEPRVLLLCEFTNCWFGTMHLDLKEEARLASVSEIRRGIEKHAETKPVFLSGDWNADAQSNTLSAIREYMTVISEERCRTFHLYKKHKPGSHYCIDFVAIDSANVGKIAVNETHVTHDLVTSDHNPIVVTVEMP